MIYETDKEYIESELRRAGLPCTPIFIKAAHGADRDETQSNVKALAESVADPREKERADRLAMIKTQYDAALAANRPDDALVYKSQMQEIVLARR